MTVTDRFARLEQNGNSELPRSSNSCATLRTPTRPPIRTSPCTYYYLTALVTTFPSAAHSPLPLIDDSTAQVVLVYFDDDADEDGLTRYRSVPAKYVFASTSAGVVQDQGEGRDRKRRRTAKTRPYSHVSATDLGRAATLYQTSVNERAFCRQ